MCAYDTPPHVIEPQFPGAYENLVSLCDCWDKDLLYDNRDEIIMLIETISKCHKGAVGYLYAAGSLLTELQMTVSDAVDSQKIIRFAKNMAQKEFSRRKDHRGQEKVRLLSAVTNKGPVLFNETVEALAPKLFVIDDNWGVASHQLLSELRRLALESGWDIISCCCPLFPFTKIDHLFIPELGLGFVTRNKFHEITVPAYRTIHARRFTDMDKVTSRKHRISFLQKAARNMIDEASSLIAEAKTLHDELEQHYITAMDFPRVDAVCDKIVREFENYIKDRNK